MRSLWPMMTIGAPGKVRPFTFQSGAVRCTSYQMEGIIRSRCVSFASSGFPVAVCDTHLDLMMPSIWYEVHLTAPDWNVKGLTLPGAPMVIIGHNERIAWGFTNNGADVQDLYIETLNPVSPDEYRVKGSWVKAQIIEETICVKG